MPEGRGSSPRGVSGLGGFPSPRTRKVGGMLPTGMLSCFFSENCFDHGYDRITMNNKLINTIDL